MIERILNRELEALLYVHPVITILGPRQSGNTTLASYYLADFHYRNLELPDVREAISQSLSGRTAILNLLPCSLKNSVPQTLHSIIFRLFADRISTSRS